MHQLQLFASILLFLTVSATPIKKQISNDVYDQRQNGTENYRVNVDGVLFAIAPAESLMTSSNDFEEFLNLLDYEDNFFIKPTTQQAVRTTTTVTTEEVTAENDGSTVKPETEKPNPVKKYGFKRRLANFILPILRRNRHQ